MSEAPNRLRELREARGLTQQDVADRIGVSTTADRVSRWEAGKNRPVPSSARKLAAVFGVSIADLELPPPAAPATRPVDDGEDFYVTDLDPRVQASHDQWRATRASLNGNRHRLAQTAAGLYGPVRLGDTGLIAGAGWIPDGPVDLRDVDLVERSDAPPPLLDGTEPQSALVRPMRSLVEPYARYTQAIRDLNQPRLFENRMCWRLVDVDWSDGKGRLGCGDSTYFSSVDMAEVLAHEIAYVALDDAGQVRTPVMRDLPYRRLVADPFDMGRRSLVSAISTLTIRAGDKPTFLLHRRDPRSVASAGGMLQVIPSGIFQPSSIVPAAREADFSLWRNIQREYSEELLGNPECDGDGQPVDYSVEPFATLDAARADGRLRVYAIGVALDALTLIGEILTVAVFEPALFDQVAADFVDRNDEGQVVAERVAFTEGAIRDLLDGGRVAPAGAGCIDLAWRWREQILPDLLPRG